jgi:hypothetical protein
MTVADDTQHVHGTATFAGSRAARFRAPRDRVTAEQVFADMTKGLLVGLPSGLSVMARTVQLACN